MSDRYQGFVQTPIGKLLVKNLGLPNPVQLERYADGEPLVDGTVAVGGTGRLAESLPGILDLLGIASTRSTDAADKYKGLVFDATGLTSTSELTALRDFFTPLLRSLETCPRVVVLGTPPESVEGERAGRAAGAGGLHPQPRQGARPRRHRPAGLRRRRGRGGHRLHPRLPALPQVRLRLRPGDPDRRHRRDERRRGPGRAAAARREGRPRHRCQPRHRRADRPGPPPRRRHRHRCRRTPGRQRAADA